MNYPLTGFHFVVSFDIFPGEVGFQEVSGLSFTVEYKTQKSGGSNSTSELRLPQGPKYDNLVLKRGYGIISGISAWVIDAVENFNYRSTNILISLLDEEHQPVSSWYVINALPLSWNISALNAEEGRIVIESLTLVYDSFKTINASAALAAAMDEVIIVVPGKITMP